MKKIEDITLKEAREMCKNQHGCDGCRLRKENGRCRIGGNPCVFDLAEPPKFSAQDIADAKRICEMLVWTSERSYIHRKYCGDLVMYIYTNGSWEGRIYLDPDLLKGIEYGEEYTFGDILGEEYFEKRRGA